MVMEEQQSDMELDSERVPVPQVQKSVKNAEIEPVNEDTGISRRKPRLRKKALHAAIVKQMEFYFSDANLSKDRFLSNLIKQNPYIDLNIFLTFNRMKELTTDINRIAKALQASTILSLSEDGMKVRRITEVIPKENTDECTVYVQNLPPDTDHERLSSIFSQYGQVVYVSIPRFKNTKKIKGFAFVEFNTPDEAKKCLKAYRKKGCVLPSYTVPDELLSITTFDDAEKDVVLGRKQEKLNQESNYTEDIVDNEEQKEVVANKINKKEKEHVIANSISENQENKNMKKIKKRKYKDIESSESVEIDEQMSNELIKTKKKKSKPSNHIDDEEMESSNEKHSDTLSEDISQKTNKCMKEVLMNDTQSSENCDENEQMAINDTTVQTNDEQENTDEKKNKRKKRKKRSKIEDFNYTMGLQVMAKKDWKHLRNKYLELQRNKMKQLKQHLRNARWNQWSNYWKNKFDKEENDEKDKTNKQDTTSTCRFSFTPGVIVKIEMDKPCTDPKAFKMDIKNNSSVKYIDVDDGSYLAYVRCDTNEAAQTFIQKSNEERLMTILEGEEEKMYWDKILSDREEKLNKKVKVKQRGRNKLLKKAEKELGKHIKFDKV
ncbi:unnamed protein product [Xylocopa violacea]|uniref:La-related protein 7 n=1 Tax=Xylocopa violacea TaxID=135666 RepID=A0ABP1PFY9_XYLVO